MASIGRVQHSGRAGETIASLRERFDPRAELISPAAAACPANAQNGRSPDHDVNTVNFYLTAQPGSANVYDDNIESERTGG
ncbi:MAG TPA: hypothetical protein VJ811_00325 [Sphingopyxis sp.]|nr:hypothetical protein [Sphingopyxis sp.]